MKDLVESSHFPVVSVFFPVCHLLRKFPTLNVIFAMFVLFKQAHICCNNISIDSGASLSLKHGSIVTLISRPILCMFTQTFKDCSVVIEIRKALCT